MGLMSQIVGAELQGQDTSNMNAPWNVLFKNAYNNNLIVNSKVTNGKWKTYIGSSWDNNGDNSFTSGFTWYDKSTIGNWAWSSHIVGVENMSKSNPPTSPFIFTYGYNKQLPYTYQTFPLSSVVFYSKLTRRRIKSCFECCRMVKNVIWFFSCIFDYRIRKLHHYVERTK